MDRTALASAEAKLHRLVYEIDRVRERSKGSKADKGAAIDRAEDAVGRKRIKSKIPHKSLKEEEVKRDGIIDKL